MTVDPALHIWLNVAALLVITGAAMYLSLYRYMD